ncbi:hypothetical protein B0A49_01296 [Cryomyces minteri]|uniref:TauD/TfdA-like domain-containing protein n=1 Tax=Cryomyces minteri TaxID=331657 RepID=A0A4U0XKE9_9PEZI|nr:hypothetical protein B0A49_01296 [Cryomyces minteri]
MLVFPSPSNFHLHLGAGRHVEFAARFGEVDDVKPYIMAGRTHRLPYAELFDVSNVDDDGNLLDTNNRRAHLNKGNGLFHVDSSFDLRRAGYSLLRAHTLPPTGMGGNTEFADSRTAFDDLPPELKHELLSKDYIACHSLMPSRRKASPAVLADLNALDFPMGRHRLVQRHEPGGRQNLYVAAHVHHIEGLDAAASDALIERLMAHATRRQNVLSVGWEADGDLLLWDSTAVMHQSAGGAFEGRFVRDMRRATVHDGSVHAWGLKEHVDTRQGFS